MKLTKFALPLILAAATLFVLSNCNRKNAQNNTTDLDANCLLKPEAGPCKGAFKVYYYNQDKKKCDEFIWGGCNGVVPFKTLKECQEKCNCE